MPYPEMKIEMPNQVAALYKEMNKKLSEIDQMDIAWITRVKQSIDLLRTIMERLRTHVTKQAFSNEQEEIHFFKFIKPLFDSKLLFYLKVYKFEAKKAVGSLEDQRHYIFTAIKKEQVCIEDEGPLYSYFNTGASYLDQLYFTRGLKDIDINYKSYLINADHLFTTAHDHTFSKFLSIESFIAYLDEQLSKLIDSINPIPNNEASLEYIGKKRWLVELIYGWYYSRVFKNADLKSIAALVQKMTNTNLGNFYRTNQELRIKTKDETAFDLWNKAYKKGNEDADANPRY